MKQLLFNIIALVAGLFVLMLSGMFVLLISLVVLIIAPFARKRGINLDARARSKWREDMERFKQTRSNQTKSQEARSGEVIEGDYKRVK
ncbi:hypothetical protein [Veronia pacifica]|uniref:Uncharacterized protein n=1 Tax=Veronia pacifica TaxID=1080227 RepID=A0A1C3EMK5_9GAMM|nr:hypothetical protein [Veronia pacifica]ODA34477.1 hypothetical protein A8L45_05765 [Veronia pacifica]